MIYDKDQFSSDDVIGCVKIWLGDIVGKGFDGWMEIVRPPNSPKKQFFFFNVPIGELKLKVTLQYSQGADLELENGKSAMSVGDVVPAVKCFQVFLRSNPLDYELELAVFSSRCNRGNQGKPRTV